MPDIFAFFGGIDFSGAKEPLSNLWTAVGREEEGRLRILSLRPHPFRADLCSFVAEGWRGAVGAGVDETVLWGADFPFGFPAAAAAHVLGGAEARWERLIEWVADRPADEVRDAVPDELRGPRLTDTGGAMSPFDLRLYKQAVEGMRWLQLLRDTTEVSICPQSVRDDATSVLLEVYPSATAHELGLPRRRAPGRPGEVRARAAALRTFLRFADSEYEAIAVSLEDAWDATIACLTAFLARDDLHQPFRATDHPRPAVELEGWIYRPPATLP
jgi:hypothetical protein